MNPDSDDGSQSSVTDWVSTTLAVVAFFSYILVIGFAPEVFTRPMSSGSLISIGLISGVVLVVFLVALAGVYTHIRNKQSSQ